jgi:hypothetical protein
VTSEEFEEYYANVSASIDTDEYFAAMMTAAWNLDGSRVTAKGWTNKDANQKKDFGARPQTAQVRSTPAASQNDTLPPMNRNDAQLLQIFRNKIKSRGARGIMGLGRLFKIFDDDNSKNLNHLEFKKAINDFRLNLADKEIDSLYKVFDNDKSGSIDYEEFLRGVRGEMNEFRKALAMKAF